MKKNLIALSAAAALASFTFAGAASAQVSVNAGGMGHKVIVPYFTAQAENATLLTITNHDAQNGKAVKVRFRSAANSDDVFDFTLLLSPSDVWTGAVTRNAETGLAQLSTSDNSCTIPADVRTQTTQFITARLDPTKPAGPQTLEGYVEIINMADIPYRNPNAVVTTGSQRNTALANTVKHVNRVAACDSSVLSASLGAALTTSISTQAIIDAQVAEATAGFDPLAPGNDVVVTALRGLSNPTGLLSADWVVINQAQTAAWSGSGTALEVNSVTGVRFWPQLPTAVAGATSANLGTLTADPLLGVEEGGSIVGAGRRNLDTSSADVTEIRLANFDLPDLSTPFDAGTAVTHIQSVKNALFVQTAANQFVTDSAIAGATDILLTQPTRRFAVAFRYTGEPESATLPRQTRVFNPSVAQLAGFTTANTSVVDRVVCLNGGADLVSFTDREESRVTNPTQFVVSPQPINPAVRINLCGEVSVISINAPADARTALSAALTRNNITIPFADGVVQFNFGGFGTEVNNGAGGTGLAAIGSSFIRAANGVVNYGIAYPHKTTQRD